MSELRAPDPTLKDIDDDLGHVERQDHKQIYVAHRLNHDYCGAWVDDALPGRVLAYIAVPCRECFPDAPPPGQRTPSGDCPPDDLAWQVQP